jgi:hypothetical protein
MRGPNVFCEKGVLKGAFNRSCRASTLAMVIAKTLFGWRGKEIESCTVSAKPIRKKVELYLQKRENTIRLSI